MDCVLATQADGTLASDVCRGCGGKNAIKPLSVYGNIFKWCTSIDVSCSDGLPSKICTRCLEMLSISYDFKRICNRTDKSLRSMTNNASASVPIPDNIISDEYEQSELRFEVQAEEIVEEKFLNDKESFDYVYKNIAEIEECVPNQPTHTTQNKIFDFEILSDERYLLPVAEKSDESSPLNERECHEIEDTEEQENSEELAFSDTEYLEDTCKEISPAYEKAGTCINNISIAGAKHEPKSTNLPMRHRCPDCGKEFSSKTNMYRHQHAHRGSKPYKCDICKKGFTQSGSLKTHKYTHFNIKPFVCNVCGQRFTQSKSVKLHLRRHTGEKPFVCDICNAAFRQKNGLQRHMKVHGERA